MKRARRAQILRPGAGGGARTFLKGWPVSHHYLHWCSTDSVVLLFLVIYLFGVRERQAKLTFVWVLTLINCFERHVCTLHHVHCELHREDAAVGC